MSRKQRSLKPRSRESVVNRNLDSEADDQGGLVPRGNYFLNPGIQNVRLFFPKISQEGKLVLRFWPMLDPENPDSNLLQGRLSADDYAGLGGMSISEPAYTANFVGISKDSGYKFVNDDDDIERCSYIIARSKAQKVEGYEFWDLPYVRLYVAAKKARDTGKFGRTGTWNSQWNELMPGIRKMPAMPGFKKQFFGVASVAENGPRLNLQREHIEYTKDGKKVVEDHPRNGVMLGDAPDDPLIVVPLTISAGNSILKLCNARKEDWSGDEVANPAVCFKYGDPTGRYNPQTNTVEGGVFFTVFDPDVMKITKNSTYVEGQQETTVTTYAAAVSKAIAGLDGKPVRATMSPEQADNVFNKHLFFWRDSKTDPADSFLLHQPTIEERCVLIAKAFKAVPDLLELCWMSSPEFLEFDSVKGILGNRTSVAGNKPETVEDEEEGQSASDIVDAFDEEAGPEEEAEFDEDFDEEGDEEYDEEGDEEYDEEGDEEGDDFDEEGDEEYDEEGDEEEYDEEGDDFDEEGDDFEEEGDEEAQDLVVDDDEEGEEFDDDGEIEAEGDEEEFDEGEMNEEEVEASDDFDDEADTSDIDAKLDESLSQAKALARSKKRTSKQAKSAKSAKKPSKQTKSAKSAKSAKKPAKSAKKSSKQAKSAKQSKSSKTAGKKTTKGTAKKRTRRKS